MNIHDVETAGFIVKRFCGVPVGRDKDDILIACSNEAVGLLTIVIDGDQIPVDTCEAHLEEIMSRYSVDTDGEVLVD